MKDVKEKKKGNKQKTGFTLSPTLVEAIVAVPEAQLHSYKDVKAVGLGFTSLTANVTHSGR